MLIEKIMIILVVILIIGGIIYLINKRLIFLIKLTGSSS